MLVFCLCFALAGLRLEFQLVFLLFFNGRLTLFGCFSIINYMGFGFMSLLYFSWASIVVLADVIALAERTANLSAGQCSR